MEKAYKFRIYPNAEQEELIEKTFGCCRYVYNYFLAERQRAYEERKETLNYYLCSALLTELKKKEVWLQEVDSQALVSSIRNLDFAYQNFFRRVKKGEIPGYPRFKSKRDRHRSYRSVFSSGNIKVLDKHIRLPKLGLISCKVSKQICGRILSATVSQSPSGKYFVSVCCTDIEMTPLQRTGEVIGIDLGIKDFVVTNDGKKTPNPRYFTKSQKKLARLQRSLSRKPKDSKNWEKNRIKVAKCHEHVVNQRNDFSHKLSTSMVRDYDVICIEDLQVKNMLKNYRLAKAISDVSWGEFAWQLQYKANWYGKEVVKVDKFFPSSQLCSGCGARWSGTKSLSVREWVCPECGVVHDRDVNAAKNILNEGVRILSKS